MKTLNIGLLGLGTVGCGVVDILTKNQDIFIKRTGKRARIQSACVRNISKSRPVNLGSICLTDNPFDILHDPKIHTVVEVMGGDSAYPFICEALRQRKHVVTANKLVVSTYKMELIECAKRQKVGFYFEASVGGGIPIIHALNVGYSANRIQSIYGILNGTTNYILTKMDEAHKSFRGVLKEAQKLGFAEADPAMDISGLDAAYKLDILAAVAFKANVSLPQIYYEGIESVGLKDILYAKEFGYTIKLLAIGRRLKEDFLSFKVYPALIPLSHPLAHVRNENNAIFISGDAVGDGMIYGKGAGGLPTASAIVADIIDIAIKHSEDFQHNCEEQLYPAAIYPMEETVSQFYLRLRVKDRYSVLENIARVFGQNKVSLLKVIQKDRVGSDAELVIVTHRVKEKNMKQAIADLKALFSVKTLFSVLRLELT